MIKLSKKQWAEYFNWFHSTFQSGCRMKPGDWDRSSWKNKPWSKDHEKLWLSKFDPFKTGVG